MTLDDITRKGIDPALALLPEPMDTPRARIMLLAIGLQESQFIHRRQLVGDPPLPTGPARSFWQAELGGGMIRGVRLHPATAKYAVILYRQAGVMASDASIWSAIESNDVLAAGLARLLLFSDPMPLPQPDDETGAWDLYLRTWRPGAWDRGTPATRIKLRSKWTLNHERAREFVLQP